MSAKLIVLGGGDRVPALTTGVLRGRALVDGVGLRAAEVAQFVCHDLDRYEAAMTGGSVRNGRDGGIFKVRTWPNPSRWRGSKARRHACAATPGDSAHALPTSHAHASYVVAGND